MRILIDGRKLGDTGIGQYTLQLLRQLLELSDDHVYVPCFDATALQELLGHPRLHAVAVTAPLFSLREQFMWRQLQRRFQPDLIHVPHFNIPWRTQVPVLCTLHDVIPLDYPQELSGPLARQYYRWANRWAYRRSATVIVPSQATRSALVRHYGPPQTPVLVLPEAAAAHFDRRERLALWARMQQRWPMLRQPYLLSVGLGKAHKRLDRSLQVIKIISQRQPQQPLPLIHAGPLDSRRQPSLPGQAAALGIEALLTILGAVSVEEMQQLYAHALALLFASDIEGFGLPILEAMACGAPALGFDNDSNREVGGSAMLLAADEGDAAALLLRLREDAAFRADRVARGLAHARQFSWQDHGAQCLQIYDRLLRASR